jgi:hypothetical protein
MKKIYLVVALQLLLLSTSYARNLMTDEMTITEDDDKPKVTNVLNHLVEKVVRYVKNEIELSKAKNNQSLRIHSVAFSGALDEQIYRQIPPQKPQFNETPLEAVKPAEVVIAPTQTTDYPDENFQWKAAIRQSVLFLGIQHSVRFSQEKTIEELKGPFFGDYVKSLQGIQGWGDGDGPITNYLGHPAMGAVTGFIYIQNSPKAKRLELGRSKKYWNSRLKAMAWSAAYSTQFEIGLVSEATLGNVGKKRGTGGYVDFVVTPTLGTVGIVLEDAADSYLIRKIENITKSPSIIRTARIVFNPMRSFANLLRLKKPWHRDAREVPY